MLEKLSVEKYYDAYHEALSSGNERRVYTIWDKTIVDYGHQKDCDIDWCKENGITVYNSEQGDGGTIVCTNGNIAIMNSEKFKRDGWFDYKFLKAFTAYLRNKGLNVELERNDVMVDGYKVASGEGRVDKHNSHNIYSCVQISINQDMEVIKHACKKPMLKVPKGLSEYGITTKEIEKWIIENFSD